MKKLLILITMLAVSGFTAQSVHAQARSFQIQKKRNKNDGLDRYYNHNRSLHRTYVIENNRPVRRDVFTDERGRYYRENAGQRIFIDRHYDSYPSRYYYRDGRARPGISLNF